MKTNRLILFFLLPFVVLNAQKYEPTTKWPYLYGDFKEGTLVFKDNGKTSMQFNIHLLGSVLHYEKDGLIYHVDNNKIAGVQIGDDNFLPIDGRLAKIAGKLSGDYLVVLTLGDFDALVSNTGAYGMSSTTSAVNKLSSIEIGGLSNLNHRQLVLEKQEGRMLLLKTEYYFIIDGNVVRASKVEVEKLIPASRMADYKKFVKENKIKWKNEESLLLMLGFIKR